jgi:putative tributyrin esterase
MSSPAFRTVELSDPALTPEGVGFVTVKSAALGRRADLCVYVPPARRPGLLPLVILLHGVYGSHWAWLFKGGADRVLERLMREEGLPAMALAMPSDGLWGDGSGYLHHGGADHGRWIVNEVPEAVACLEPAVRGGPCFLAGLSMGGYGTLRLGALQAGRFAGLSAHSSVTDLSRLRDFVEEDPAAWQLGETAPLAVLDCLRANADRLPPLRFDCGTEDDLIADNRALHAGLLESGIGHEYAEFPGGHTWAYWHEHLVDSLRFFGRILTGQAASR